VTIEVEPSQVVLDYYLCMPELPKAKLDLLKQAFDKSWCVSFSGSRDNGRRDARMNHRCASREVKPICVL